MLNPVDPRFHRKSPVRYVQEMLRNNSSAWKARRMGTTEGPQPKPGLADDPRALRALAHPTRLALLEILGTRDQATATQCAELLAQTVANCSFHLRTLASHGFIGRVPGTTGKDRPWRALSTRQDIGEPCVALAGEASERESAVAEFERFFLARVRPVRGAPAAAGRSARAVAEGTRLDCLHGVAHGRGADGAQRGPGGSGTAIRPSGDRGGSHTRQRPPGPALLRLQPRSACPIRR